MDLRPVVIYHANCADGVAAAWCFWKKFGDMMEYIPGNYDVPLDHFVGRNVYFVDFSVKRDKMEQIIAEAGTVILLDHHISALENLKGLKGLDMTHCTIELSGAGIAWQFLNPGKQMPLLLTHVQDRDLWKFEHSHTHEIMAWLFSHKLTLQEFDTAVALVESNQRPAIIAQGATLLRKFEKDLNSIMEQCSRRIELAGYHILVANANGMYASELGNRLAQGAPFAATYYDSPEGRKWSLRSTENGVDVAAIAKLYGGGGHKNAAGFAVHYNHHLARI